MYSISVGISSWYILQKFIQYGLTFSQVILFICINVSPFISLSCLLLIDSVLVDLTCCLYTFVLCRYIVLVQNLVLFYLNLLFDCFNTISTQYACFHIENKRCATFSDRRGSQFQIQLNSDFLDEEISTHAELKKSKLKQRYITSTSPLGKLFLMPLHDTSHQKTLNNP